MAKFELSIYDTETGEIAKKHKRGFMPVNLYIRFQKLAEKLAAEKIKSDEEMFKALQPLFLETFPAMTEEEYQNQVDLAEVLRMFAAILNKSTEFAEGDSKNG